MAKKRAHKKSSRKSSYGYGKKSWLKPVLIYLLIGGVAYLLIYYIFLRPTGGSIMPY